MNCIIILGNSVVMTRFEHLEKRLPSWLLTIQIYSQRRKLRRLKSYFPHDYVLSDGLKFKYFGTFVAFRALFHFYGVKSCDQSTKKIDTFLKRYSWVWVRQGNFTSVLSPGVESHCRCAFSTFCTSRWVQDCICSNRMQRSCAFWRYAPDAIGRPELHARWMSLSNIFISAVGWKRGVFPVGVWANSKGTRQKEAPVLLMLFEPGCKQIQLKVILLDFYGSRNCIY